MNLSSFDALILAGGKSSRFKSDKTLVPFKSSPSLTHFSFDKLKTQFKSVKICAKEQKFSPPLPLLKDNFSDFAPIFVLANLGEFYENPVFILPADMPNVSISSIIKLFENFTNCEVNYAKTMQKEHFLCGVFSPKIAKIAREQILKNDLAIKNLLKHCKAKSTLFTDENEFININYQKDLENSKNSKNSAI